MASKIKNEPDNEEDILYVKRQKKDRFVYGGYKREYLARNLSEVEEGFVICKICVGITRNASLYEEETTCKICSESPADANHVKLVQTAVNQLEINCPVHRWCNWSGKLSEAEEHLRNCESFLIQCDLCEEVFSRSERELHRTEKCPLRIIKCIYCYQDKEAKFVSRHFTICFEFPISCPNECGAEFLRRELSEHRSECVLEVVTCPYKEYGCKAESMLRRDLLAHKKEFYIEHLDMSSVQMSKIEHLKDEITCLKKEQNEMKLKGMSMRQLDGVEWEIKNPDELKFGKEREGPTLYVNKYKLRIYYIGGIMNSYFYLRRIAGEFDRSLGFAYVTHYRVVIVKKRNYSKSVYEEGIMNYQLKIGTKSEKIKLNIVNDSPTSILLRFYFDVNSNPAKNLGAEYSEETPFPNSIWDDFDMLF